MPRFSKASAISPIRSRRVGPVPCLDKPVCARSMRAGTLFGVLHFGVGRSGENFKASQADRFVPVSSGHLKGDWVYSAG
jgi:hypothetical protein